MSQRGRVALVTGGTEGIGKAAAMRLLDDGLSVVVTGRRTELGNKLVADVGDDSRLSFVRADALDPDDANRVAAECRERFGPVDVLVNNVGGGTGDFGAIHELDPSVWERTMALNVYSAVWMTRAVTPDMLATRRGRIIMVASLEGKLPTMPNIGPYVAAKHAVIGLAKSIALDYGPFGVTCNAVCPGYVEIPTRVRKAARQVAEGRYADPQQNYKDLTRTGRHATLDEVAHAIAMLADERSGAITGATINVDGGSSPY